MKKLYFVKDVNDMEMITCPTCNGEGTIIGTVSSDALDAPIENHVLSCPTCGGSKKISTGKMLHYAVGTVCIYGEAKVEDGSSKEEYMLGFVCDDDNMIERFKEQNHIDNFADYPSALSFYVKNTDTKMYETYEEAYDAMTEAEKNWKPDLKVVE